MQVDADPQVSLQTAPSSHWKVHLPPGQEFAQIEPFLQSMVQPPPAHDASHVAPERQRIEQWPPEHEGVHVPDTQVNEHPPPGQLVEQPPSSQAQPASAAAWPPQRGSDAASRSAPSAGPPSRGRQTRCSWPSTASHCASSPAETAWVQVYCWLGCVHQSHRVESTSQGPGLVSGKGVESEQAVTTSATRDAASSGPEERGAGTADLL